MDFSLKARTWRSLAAATPPWKRRSTSPISPRTSRSCIGVTSSRPRPSSWTNSWKRRKTATYASNGIIKWMKSSATTPVSSACASRTTPAKPRTSRSRARSSPSATRPTPASSKASSPCKAATSRPKAAPMATPPLPACRACSPPAMCRTISTARPSPPPAAAAWPRSTPSVICKRYAPNG